MPTVLALIPARSGSKGVPDKNIRSVGGKPMLVYSIEQAKASSLINRVIVSTDSEQYAEIAQKAGAEVPFLRPAEISGDLSTDLDVFQHALKWLQDNEGSVPDIIVQLRPTYPFRNIKDIDRIIEILLEDPTLDSVRTISSAPATPFKMWLKDGNLLKPAVTSVKEGYNLPRQLLPQTYLQNACIDAVRSSVILTKHSMTGERIYGYLMDENYDIDTHADIRRLEQALANVGGTMSDKAVHEPKTICVDIDGVIASIVPDNNYELANPVPDMIAVIKRLYDTGHRIILSTARGSATGKDWKEVTEKQMKDWGVPYHELWFGKPAADVYIDDRAVPLPALLDLQLHHE